MILDTSALPAVLLTEPEAALFVSEIEGASVVRMSAASYVEAAIYVDRNGDEVRRAMLDTLSGAVLDSDRAGDGGTGPVGAPGFRSFWQGPA